MRELQRALAEGHGIGLAGAAVERDFHLNTQVRTIEQLLQIRAPQYPVEWLAHLFLGHLMSELERNRRRISGGLRAEDSPPDALPHGHQRPRRHARCCVRREVQQIEHAAALLHDGRQRQIAGQEVVDGELERWRDGLEAEAGHRVRHQNGFAQMKRNLCRRHDDVDRSRLAAGDGCERRVSIPSQLDHVFRLHAIVTDAHGGALPRIHRLEHVVDCLDHHWRRERGQLDADTKVKHFGRHHAIATLDRIPHRHFATEPGVHLLLSHEELIVHRAENIQRVVIHLGAFAPVQIDRVANAHARMPAHDRVRASLVGVLRQVLAVGFAHFRCGPHHRLAHLQCQILRARFDAGDLHGVVHGDGQAVELLHGFMRHVQVQRLAHQTIGDLDPPGRLADRAFGEPDRHDIVAGHAFVWVNSHRGVVERMVWIEHAVDLLLHNGGRQQC